VIVYALEGSGVVDETKGTLSPVANLVLAVLMWVLAGALATGPDKRREQRGRRARAKGQEQKETPKWQQQLSKGSPRTTFVIGAVLTLPGATYLIALNDLSKENYPVTVTVLVVIVFNLIQLLLIEVPIVALKVAPDRTPALLERAKEWARLHGREYGAWALVALGAMFAIRGLLELFV
jgi:hypothetical protein